MERCLMCEAEMKGRKGKVVCSTTCRVNKKKAFDYCETILLHLTNQKYRKDDFPTDREWKRFLLNEIVEFEKKRGQKLGLPLGNVAKAWSKAKHPRHQQLVIEDLK